MTEEDVTRALLIWLNDTDWEILAYDFPQSGTGHPLRPNSSDGEKNKGTIIPDIIARRNDTCVFFENKDRIDVGDFCKVNMLRTTEDYHESICDLLSGISIERIYFGIGIPASKYEERRIGDLRHLSDFIVTVEPDGTVIIRYDSGKILVDR